jgi:hypothetical protein
MATEQGGEINITYVVGEEKRLTDILSAAEVVPLLKGMVRAGAAEVAVLDAAGNTLWLERDPAAGGSLAGNIPIFLEGEPVGKLVIKGSVGREEPLKGLASLLLDALNTIIANNLKRMLTTEVHTAVVNQSYEDLVETNRRLAESEAQYRELAGELEKKVDERTSELKLAHARLLQQEKMASIGQLAAGMAHEINNPLQMITSQAGWPASTPVEALGRVVGDLKSKGVRVSIFVDPVPDAIRWAASVGGDRVELYTEPYARAFEAGPGQARDSFDDYARAARLAHEMGLGVNAGHDLDLENLVLFRTLPYLDEVSIGHAIVSRAVFVGLATVVREYLERLGSV